MFQFTGSRHGIKDEKTQFNKKCQQHIYTAGTAFGKELRAEQKYDSGTKGFRSGKFQFSGKSKGQQNHPERGDERWKFRGEVANPEQGISTGNHPVIQRRILQKWSTVQRRDKKVSVQEHFCGNTGDTGLIPRFNFPNPYSCEQSKQSHSRQQDYGSTAISSFIHLVALISIYRKI